TDSENKPVSFRGVVWDITERKQADEKLKESGRLNDLLLDSLPHPAMLIDRSRHVIAANSVALELGTVIGGYCWKGFGGSRSIPEEDRCYVAENDGAIPEGGTKCTFCLADESVFAEESKNIEVTIEDNVFDTWWVPVEGDVFLHYAVDITERKRLEAQLQQSLKMEAVGTLSGGIAHDFNNILGIIVGNTEMALIDTPEASPAHENLSEIREASMRARDIVKQILAFSRQKEQALSPIELGPTIVESLRLMRSIIPTTVEIKQNISSNTGVVSGDPSQINQILLNLCTNASHAMKDAGGILEVSLENITLGSAASSAFSDLAPGDYVKLSVCDNGHGIAPGKIDRIFDPYFTTKAVGEGTGMGLSVIHGIVTNHGGAIAVNSKVGKGTTFDVLFPIVSQTLESESGAQDSVAGGNESILLVDDEPAMVKVYQSLLERLGYTVAVRTSSVEALEAFKAQPDKYDVIITDQTMPHLTGQMLSAEVMGIRPDIPVILCTGHSDLVDEDRAGEMGISAFVMKPISMGDIAKTIRGVLDGDGYQI
ncbi:MAG: response regulator, partial [Desulfobacterales bacterium]